MFYNNINPTLLRFGPFEIRYYGIIFVAAFVIAYFMIYYLAQKRELKLSRDDVADYLFYEIVGVVVGARLFEIIFYEPAYYFSSPFQMLAVWKGGLSFHGGLVGGVIATLLFCRRKKIRFYDLIDIIVIPAAFGLFLGRIANFTNGELVGRVTGVPWCVKFRNYEGCRHPSQLYESFKNLVIFFGLWFLKDKKLKRGMLFWSFVVMYSVLRFFIEFFKDPVGELGLFLGLTTGQWLNIAMFITGIVFMVRIKNEQPVL